MAHRLHPVELEFADSAPLRLSFAARLAVPPEEIYVALAEEAETWPEWFGAVTSVRPTGHGRGREVRLRGGGHFTETVLAAYAVHRYAYRVDHTNAPGIRAMLEDWRLSPERTGGTRVEWIVALDGGVALRAARPLLRRGLRGAFRGAMRKLEERLTAGRNPGPGPTP